MENTLYTYPEGYKEIQDLLTYLPEEMRASVMKAYAGYIISGMI